jgi:hypothetical protein
MAETQVLCGIYKPKMKLTSKVGDKNRECPFFQSQIDLHSVGKMESELFLVGYFLGKIGRHSVSRFTEWGHWFAAKVVRHEILSLPALLPYNTHAARPLLVAANLENLSYPFKKFSLFKPVAPSCEIELGDFLHCTAFFSTYKLMIGKEMENWMPKPTLSQLRTPMDRSIVFEFNNNLIY